MQLGDRHELHPTVDTDRGAGTDRPSLRIVAGGFDPAAAARAASRSRHPSAHPSNPDPDPSPTPAAPTLQLVWSDGRRREPVHA